MLLDIDIKSCYIQAPELARSCQIQAQNLLEVARYRRVEKPFRCRNFFLDSRTFPAQFGWSSRLPVIPTPNAISTSLKGRAQIFHRKKNVCFCQVRLIQFRSNQVRLVRLGQVRFFFHFLGRTVLQRKVLEPSRVCTTVRQARASWGSIKGSLRPPYITSIWDPLKLGPQIAFKTAGDSIVPKSKPVQLNKP